MLEITPFAIVLLLFVTTPKIQRQPIDRIVAVVGSDVITLSDIRAEIVMRKVLGEPAAKNDREVLDELIDQRLIRAELDHYPRAEPAKAELDEALAQIKDTRGLPLDTVRAAVRDHLRVQNFIMDMFGQFISVTDDEIQKYYDEILVPDARVRGLTPVPELAAVRADIGRNITQEKLTVQVKKWVQGSKRITKVEIFN